MATSMYCGMPRNWPTASRSVVLDQLHGIRRQPDFVGRFCEQLDDRLARMHRFLAAAQDHRVAALHADRRRIGRDVGPRLVDEEHDAQRHADFVDSQAIGAAAVDLISSPIGSGRAGDCLRALWRSSSIRWRQPQAVDLRRR